MLKNIIFYLGRLSELIQRQNDEIIYSEQLSYDAEDNVLSDGKNHFEYDELNRLAKATDESGKSREYSYDAYGNRASLTENGSTVTYLYNEANQLLSSSDGLSFKYDRRGNMIEKSKNGDVLNTYIYGANNRITRAKNEKGDEASYAYNGLGFRVNRKANGINYDYILDQTIMYNNLLESEGDSYIWSDDTLLFTDDVPSARDRLGSPLDMPEFGGISPAETLGFTGYMYDDISGTYFAQAREYLPDIGRFTGRDIVKGTIEQPQTLNNYHYCYSNPIKYVDWDGRDAIYMTDYTGAGVFGHTSILVQDDNGKWQHINFRASKGKTLLTVKPVDTDNMIIDEKAGTVQCNGKESKGHHRINSLQPLGKERYFDHEKDYGVYLKGDYSKSYKKAKEYIDNEKIRPKYNLIGKNCAWVSIKLLAESYPKDSEIRKRLEYMLWEYDGKEELIIPNNTNSKFKKAMSLD